MRKLIKELFIKVCSAIIIGIGVYVFFPNLLISIAISGFLIAIAFGKPVYKLINHFFRKSEKLKCYFDFIKFIDPSPQNLEIVNLGSNSGKYALEYDNSVRGANWALGPQTLYYDFNILKQYHSYLKPNAFVIVPLCPFSGCIKNFAESSVNLKYYSFLHPAMIHEYSKEIQKTITPLIFHPILLSVKLYGIKSFIRNSIASFVKLHPSKLLINPMNKETLEKDAEQWIKGWKEQFNIKDLDSKNIPEEIKNAVQFNAEILSKMIDFCRERDLILVFVLPPVTKMLNSKLSNSFKELYIYSLFNGSKKNDVQFLNYLGDERFSDDNYYFNSYFLNASGRKLFTNQLLKDIKLT